MDELLIALALITLCAWVAIGYQVTAGNHAIADLQQTAPLAGHDLPRVSIIVSARDEEHGIERAVRSMLNQDYPDYEVVAVDDRSTDATGEIPRRMTVSDGRLRVLRVENLPPGRLGKNNALHLGSSVAAGSLLLFSDADVVMDATVLRRAVRYFLERRLDHLAAAPRVIVRGFLSHAMLSAFGLLFSIYAQPWRATVPTSSKHAGMGAFNLVRAAAYRVIGGHTRIAMRPDDDMKLGKRVKAHGFRQEFVLGTTLLSVEWYSSFRQMVRGLMKNMFAGVEYSGTLAVAGSIVQLLLNVWPFMAVVVMDGWARVLNGATVTVIYSVLFVNSSRLG
ncbi:MAG: glycosyltransferase [Bryobacterales bacterium]|nr:glycosyltransferase [Bryobacterales bacterium]